METHPYSRALRRQRLEEAKRGATEKSLMYMAWGPGALGPWDGATEGLSKNAGEPEPAAEFRNAKRNQRHPKTTE